MSMMAMTSNSSLMNNFSNSNNVTLFDCREPSILLDSSTPFRYQCQPSHEEPYGLPTSLVEHLGLARTMSIEGDGILYDDNSYPALFPIFNCQNDTLDIPNRKDCSSECMLVYRVAPIGSYSCASCSFLEGSSTTTTTTTTGSINSNDYLVYDCRVVSGLWDDLVLVNQTTDDDDNDEYENDVVVEESCAARNAQGECGDFVHWFCMPMPIGTTSDTADEDADQILVVEQDYYYYCWIRNRATILEEPVFPFDKETMLRNSFVALYCQNDISGLSHADCENPKCTVRESDGPRCDKCTVLTTQTQNIKNKSAKESPYDFAYDCSVLNISCKILDEGGNCQQPNLALEQAHTGIQPLSVPDSKIQGIPYLEEEEDEYSRKKHGRTWSWTIRGIDPTILNVLFDLVGFVSRISFGLAFAAIYPWILTHYARMNNRAVPLTLLNSVPGDVVQATQLLPSFSSTIWWPAAFIILLLFLADFSHTIAMFGFDFIEEKTSGPMRPTLYLSNSTTDRNLLRSYTTSGDPVFSRTLSIPAVATAQETEEDETGGNFLLQAREQSSLMAAFTGASRLIVSRATSPFLKTAVNPQRESLDFGGYAYDTSYMPDNSPLAVMAREIPLDCLLSRDTDTAELQPIQEVINGGTFDEPFYTTAMVPHCTFGSLRLSGIFQSEKGSAEIVETADSLTLIDFVFDGGIHLYRGNESLYQEFTLTHEQRRLARDRTDWRNGRVVENLLDRISIGNVTISIGRIVLASGIAGTQTSTYGFFGEIVDECPPRPSTLPSLNTQCIAILQANCDTFEEDSNPLYDDMYAPVTSVSNCKLSEATILWGRNFVADGNLVSVVAGLYGMVRPTLAEFNAFKRHSVLAALFLLGTLDQAPSNDTVVVAQVNILFLIFMLLPIVLSILLVVLAFRQKESQIMIPSGTWEIMVFGKEESEIPKRMNKTDPFPKIPEDVVVYFFDASDGRNHVDSNSRLHSKPTTQSSARNHP